MDEHKLIYGSKEIKYQLVFDKRKSLNIKVLPSGQLVITAPDGTDIEKINEKLKLKAPWILKQMDYFQTFQPLTSERKYINGESHLYSGRQYRLRAVVGNEECIKISSGWIQITSANISNANLKKMIDLWYLEKAKNRFPKILDLMIPKFEKFNITKPEIVIRKMQKRWGSCTSKGKIILNTELIKAPKGSIEYVVVHELCHLVHRKHNKKFYALQEKIMPDWKRWKDKLEYCLA